MANRASASQHPSPPLRQKRHPFDTLPPPPPPLRHLLPLPQDANFSCCVRVEGCLTVQKLEVQQWGGGEGSTRRKHQNSKVLPLFWQGLEEERNSTRTAALSSPPRSSKSHPPSSAPFYTACPTFSLLSFPLPISLLRLPYFKARKKSPSTAAQETRPSPPPPLPPRPRPSMHVSGPLCIQQSGGAASPLFLSPISRGISLGGFRSPLFPSLPLSWPLTPTKRPEFFQVG